MLYEKIICGPVPFLQEFNNLAILYQTLANVQIRYEELIDLFLQLNSTDIVWFSFHFISFISTQSI